MTITNNTGISYLTNFEDLMFGERIAYVIETKGISKAWIAEKLGISKQALNYLLKHSIKPKFIDEFAEILGIDAQWLETGIGSPSIKKNEAKVIHTATLPIMTALELLGHKKINQKMNVIDFSCSNPTAYIAYKLEDNSNFPPFIEGSILIFDTHKQPANEDYVLSIIDNAVLVRQYLVDGKNICYRASNGEHKTFINPEAKCLGVLVEARYKIN